jgi:hypothetical protein
MKLIGALHASKPVETNKDKLGKFVMMEIITVEMVAPRVVWR